jgi:hypothetical protein
LVSGDKLSAPIGRMAGSGMRRKPGRILARKARRCTDRGQAGFLTSSRPLCLELRKYTPSLNIDGQAKCRRKHLQQKLGRGPFRPLAKLM